jgi:hypothetical protein
VQVLRRLLEFYEAGGTVIILGPGLRFESDATIKKAQLVRKLPLRSVDGRSDNEVKDLVARLWGEQASGRGRAHLVAYKDVTDFLYSLNAHDVWIDPNLPLLQYYHRRLAKRDVYFFNNEGEAVTTTVRLRGVKGVPELWDPVSGRICQAPCAHADEDGVSVRLQLARYESVFIVLNPEAKPATVLQSCDADEVVRSPDGGITLRKYGPGTIQCEVLRPHGGEEKRLSTPSRVLAPLHLQEGWSETPDESGGTLYKCRFDWPLDAVLSAALVIEGMTQVIEAKLNGKELGLRFAYPFRFELEDALRPGSNELELRHVERYSFESHLGNIRIVPYYELRL